MTSEVGLLKHVWPFSPRVIGLNVLLTQLILTCSKSTMMKYDAKYDESKQ